MNRHWSGDKVFEEARKIVIAQLQHITYKEFLPVILGHNYIRDYELGLGSSAYDSTYEMDLDGTTLNEFATIVVPIAFSWLATPHVAFAQQFNNPDSLYENSGIENIFRWVF